MSQELQRIARDLRRLSVRFQDYARSTCKTRHLIVNVTQSAVQAGRLLVAAIDGGAFPKSAEAKNGAWWDRRQGRLPGGPLAVLGTVGWRKGEPTRFQGPAYLAAAAGPLDGGQCAACWAFALVSWLVRAFPDRFRDRAGSWDWSHILPDYEGYSIGQDGTGLDGRWYKNGKLLPRRFKWPRCADFGGYNWRFDRRRIRRAEPYDDADRLAFLRVRAEVSSDACLVLSDLIGPENHDGDPPDEPVQHVTRSQAAAIVNRSPRTFEHYNDMPKPAIPGGKGRPAEWEWPVIRPWLASTFGRLLPVRFPADRFVRE